MKNRFARACSVLAAGVAVTSVIGLSAASVATASVKPDSSIGCRVNDASNGCGTQQEDNTNLVWAVPSGTPKSGTPVVLQQFSNARSDQDFEMVNINGLSSTNGGGPDKRFQLAENGDKTGLCISDTNNRAYNKLILRPCNSSIWQEFVPVYFDGTVAAWATAQGGQAGGGWVIQDPGYAGNGVQLNVGPYDAQDNQLWVYNDYSTPVTSF